LFLDFKAFLKKNEGRSDLEYIYLLFDSKGGDTFFAAKMIDLIRENKNKFIGLAYGEVHSAAIQIFLSTHLRFGYLKASALIHRAKKSNSKVSDKEIKKVEKQIFETIAEKLEISLAAVYKMANKQKGKGTYLDMDHPLGTKFFISIL